MRPPSSPHPRERLAGVKSPTLCPPCHVGINADHVIACLTGAAVLASASVSRLGGELGEFFDGLPGGRAISCGQTAAITPFRRLQ